MIIRMLFSLRADQVKRKLNKGSIMCHNSPKAGQDVMWELHIWIRVGFHHLRPPDITNPPLRAEEKNV